MRYKEAEAQRHKGIRFIPMVLVVLFFSVLCLAPSSDPWDGTGWDVTAPDIDQPHGKDYLELQDLRKGVAIRMNKEHVTLAASSAGGEHKNGSAVAYEGTSEPTNRPDGATALADNAYDRGRLWLDDNFNPPVLKRWDGSAWEVVGTIAAGTSPRAYMHNTTHEDTERGRESQIRAYGEQSGGEQSTLGYAEFSHDGTSDDQKGRYLIVLNDGDDDDAPSKIAIVFQSDGTIDAGDSISVLDEDDMASDSATQIATQQSIKAYADTKIAKDGSTAYTGTGDGFKDEDDMASDSATATASQQSIKAYVGNQIAARSQVVVATPKETDQQLTDTNYHTICTLDITTVGGTLIVDGVIGWYATGGGISGDIKICYDGTTIEEWSNLSTDLNHCLTVPIKSSKSGLAADTYTITLEAKTRLANYLWIKGTIIPSQLFVMEIP